jgi:hypothetical protein
MGLVLGVALATGAYAQAVMNTVSVKVNPGQAAAYQQRVAALQGVMDRLGGGATVQTWNATQAGQNSGTTLVAVSYPSLSAWADLTQKTTADAEWQKLSDGLPAMRTLISNSLMVSRDGSTGPPATASGSVLQGVLLKVNPGQLDTYLQRVAELRKIQEQIGSSGQMRIWQATLAGTATGTVAVGIIHPSLTEYAANTEKINASAEAQAILNGLDDIRTLESTSLFVSP